MADGLMNAELVFDWWLQISLEVAEDWYPFRPAWVRKKTVWNHLIKCLRLTMGIMVKAIKRNLLELFRSSNLVYVRWKLKQTFIFPLLHFCHLSWNRFCSQLHIYHFIRLWVCFVSFPSFFDNTYIGSTQR